MSQRTFRRMAGVAGMTALLTVVGCDADPQTVVEQVVPRETVVAETNKAVETTRTNVEAGLDRALTEYEALLASLRTKAAAVFNDQTMEAFDARSADALTGFRRSVDEARTKLNEDLDALVDRVARAKMHGPQPAAVVPTSDQS